MMDQGEEVNRIRYLRIRKFSRIFVPVTFLPLLILAIGTAVGGFTGTDSTLSYLIHGSAVAAIGLGIYLISEKQFSAKVPEMFGSRLEKLKPVSEPLIAILMFIPLSSQLATMLPTGTGVLASLVAASMLSLSVLLYLSLIVIR